MLLVLTIFPITSNDMFDNFAKLANKEENKVTPPRLTPEKLINSLQKTLVAVVLPSVILVKFGQESIISKIGELFGNVDPVCAYD